MDLTTSTNWVDTHFHVFNANQAVASARYVPSYAASLSEWMAQARSVGVSRGVCVQPSFLGFDNSLLLQTVSAHPRQLRGVAVVAAETPPDELQAMHAQGVRGIRLNLAGTTHDVAAWARADRLWQCLHALNWHLEVHTSQGELPKVLAQLPSDMALVVDHMAKPLAAKSSDGSVKALVQRAKHASTHIKLSGAYRLGAVDAASLAHLWLHELGPQALLWGSDWPCTNHEQLATYDDLFAPLASWVGVAHLETVLSINPQRVYG